MLKDIAERGLETALKEQPNAGWNFSLLAGDGAVYGGKGFGLLVSVLR